MPNHLLLNLIKKCIMEKLKFKTHMSVNYHDKNLNSLSINFQWKMKNKYSFEFFRIYLND